ncbi:MAG: hypothetical protein NTU61_01065, partial [Candidatus Altiarchaeota archaeon]|nr:hypothetical protein [Candidatus Altiarchaeota archaeon]
GGFPTPMPAHASGGGKVRILVVDNETSDLEGIRTALAADYREVTAVRASDAATAVKAFKNQDIVIVDQDLKGDWTWEGVDAIAEIKKIRPETVAILNSAMPIIPRGRSEFEADYVHVKGVGATIKRGERKSLIQPGVKPTLGYENLAKLVSEIEQEKLGLKQ